MMCFFSQTKWLQYLKNLTKQRRPFKTLCAKGLWETGLCRFFVIRKNGYCLQFFQLLCLLHYGLIPRLALKMKIF
jgi:hypothetical protein